MVAPRPAVRPPHLDRESFGKLLPSGFSFHLSPADLSPSIGRVTPAAALTDDDAFMIQGVVSLVANWLNRGLFCC
jgi:hypothetical protein